MRNEIWKDIKNYEGLYQVSNLGKIKSINYNRTKKSKLLKFSITKGYYRVHLCKNKKIKSYFVHRLVAEAFIDNPLNKPFINHLDCNTKNNYYKNLEWCTQKENINYAQKINSSYNDRNKKVGQYDKNNNLIKVYDSISEASRQTGIFTSSISYSANKKRKSGGGYIWKFIIN